LAKVLAEFVHKQVVSVIACANQFCPLNSSGIKLSGKRTVQTDSCLNSEQNGTLLISVGVRKGVGGAQNVHVTVMDFFFGAPALFHVIRFIVKLSNIVRLLSSLTGLQSLSVLPSDVHERAAQDVLLAVYKEQALRSYDF